MPTSRATARSESAGRAVLGEMAPGDGLDLLRELGPGPGPGGAGGVLGDGHRVRRHAAIVPHFESSGNNREQCS